MPERIQYDLFQRLLDQARVLVAFIDAHGIEPSDPDDDRAPELRAADFVAERAGYTYATTPTSEDVVAALWVALDRERCRGGARRVDDAPDFAP